jgi:ketosteroid isomerase-like protein
VSEPEEVARSLIAAFSAADFDAMRSLLADDLRAYVTNAEGGVDEVVGADEYLGRIEAMDLPSARFSVSITQMVAPAPGQVMAMVEVRAARNDLRLHNHAAHLLTLDNGRVSEWWMVEALPAESDAFWGSD